MRDERSGNRRDIFCNRRKAYNFGPEARAKEQEMNRVSECDNKKSEPEVEKVKIGSLWRRSGGGKPRYFIATTEGGVNLETGRTTVEDGYSPNPPFLQYPEYYAQVYCVTIERDRE